MKSPAFQFYPDDFIGGTVVFTTEETGAYIRLLCYQWGNGKIPSEKFAVERIAGGRVSDAVLAKFKNGKQPRLEEERKKQREYREKQRINGEKGGRPAKPKPNPSLSFGFDLGSEKQNPKKALLSPSPSPSPKRERESINGSHSFSEIPSWDEFWQYCLNPTCGLCAEWYAKDKWEAATASNWKGKENWKAHARRCRTWWEQDGRPMQPPRTKTADNSCL